MPIPFQKEKNKTGEIAVIGVHDRSDVLKRIEDGTFTSALVQDGGMLKSLTLNLVLNNIPFTKINYGAGVYRIMREEKMEGK